MSALEKEAEALRSEGCQAIPLKLDTTGPASAAELPDVDILVNVAGTNIRKPFEEYTAEEYELVMRTNLHGLVQLTQKIGGGGGGRGRVGKYIFIRTLVV